MADVMNPGQGRHFLFLQGPHGPFFSRLAGVLCDAGHRASRVGVNQGDAHFWRDRDSFHAYHGDLAEWPGHLGDLVERLGVTDVVIYNDTRPLHAAAITLARARRLTLHVFEEGYLRPYWVTYERGGTNGNSRLMHLSIDQMEDQLEGAAADVPAAPARWGAMRQHILYGALYHAFILLANRSYGGFRSHRSLTVNEEFRLYLKRLLLMPLHRIRRAAATWRIRSGSFPYHLVLLQLPHDENFLRHGPFDGVVSLLDEVIAAFAEGAPRHHHLVFKAHPLDDGRVDLQREIARIGKTRGVGSRMHFVPGGKLAPLLDQANSAVTVNSTAAQQALWRGLPLKALGKAVFSKPELVSSQPLPDFFREPERCDSAAYRLFRQYLLETSQIPGSFYSAAGRRQLLRRIVDLMLAPDDPYECLARARATQKPQLKLVKS